MARLDVACSLVFVAALAAGCAGDDGGGGDGGPPLACDSLTLCTYAEVTTYHTTLAEPAGGTIVDGQYRLAWIETERAADDGRLDSLMALEIRGGTFRESGNSTGYLGTITTSGTDLTMHSTERCVLSVDDGSTEASWTYGYTATANQLRLRDTVSGGSDGTWHVVRVYQRMASPDELCALESDAPTSPGDSAVCWASNCFCAYAVNTELAASSCPF